MAIAGKLRWQDLANLAVGFWIGVSPWLLGYSESLPFAMWNALIVGAAIAVIAAIDLDLPARWEEWTLAALGGWLAISPLLLGYRDNNVVTGAMLASGVVVLVLALWALFSERPLRSDEHPAPGH
jgi:hypothetical protein